MSLFTINAQNEERHSESNNRGEDERACEIVSSGSKRRVVTHTSLNERITVQ